ncbi:MAG: fimbrillin family protein [Rikenellaceae bacterium]
MKRLLLPLCGVMLAMVSCVDTDPIDTSTDVEVALEIYGNNISQGSILSNDRVGLYFGDDYQNVEYSMSVDGAMSAVGATEIILTSTAKQTLTAYYPYEEGRALSYALDITDQDGIETLYWGSATSSSSKFDIDFGSIYAKIYCGASNVKYDDMTCTLVGGVTTKGSFNLATGAITNSSTDGASFDLVVDGDIAELTLNVIPCEDLASVGLKFESVKGSYSYTYYPLTQDSEWAADEFYSYDLVLPTTDVPVTAISLDKETLMLTETETTTLVATVSPSTALNVAVVWSSSDSSVVLVDEGVVTAIKPGTATITAMSVDGCYTATCVITVNEY